MRKLLLLAVIFVGCSDDTTGSGGETGTTTTGTPAAIPSFSATYTCAGAPHQLTCPSATSTFTETVQSTNATEVDCLGPNGDRVTMVVPSPTVGDLKQLGVKFFVALTCPGGTEVRSLNEISGGTVTIEAIDPGVSVRGSFASDTGDASGQFVAVAP